MAAYKPLIDSSKQILNRAIDLDEDNKPEEALICYEQGIQVLIDALKLIPETATSNKKVIREEIKKYLTRAEEIKSVNFSNFKKQEHIEIENGSTGYGYEKILGKYFADGSVTAMHVQDPYIRNSNQIKNFLHLCEVALSSISPVDTIRLTTGKDKVNPDEQLTNLNLVKQELSKFDVTLTFDFDPTLHDRQIRLDSGWIIKIGRGLDYVYKPNSNAFLGTFDFDYRKCSQTTVDIYHEGAVKK